MLAGRMLEPGATIDRYEIERLLGEGGMGAVYAATDKRLDRRVALKVVRVAHGDGAEAQSAATARLMREARAAAKLDHPNAIAVYDVGEHDGMAFIAMELVDGATLRARIDEGSVPLQTRLSWLLDIARALGAAHRAGLVHRDVKPENVMVRKDGVVKVLDFGIARRVASALDPSAPTEAGGLGTLTAPGTSLGTPRYMAPEQMKGEAIDGRADQFAWGVTAYELLTGRVPWASKADSLSQIAAILTETPASLRSSSPEVPAEIDALVLRTLAKLPGGRFASMDDLVGALEPLVGPRADPVGRSSAVGAPQSAGPRAELRQYSTEEVREVLSRAIDRQESGGRFGHDELVAAAREAGVDDAVLAEAVRDLDSSRRREVEPADDRARSLRKLWRSIATYVVLMLFMVIMFHGAGWIGWVAAGWGVAISLQAIKLLFPPEATPVRRASPRAADARVDDGVSVLLSTASRRVRVEAAAPTADAGPDPSERARAAARR